MPPRARLDEAPAWLIELASRDDPPTEITRELLARFAAAGIEELVPTDGSKILPAEEATRTIGIGAHCPGCGFADSFEGEPAQVAASLDRLLAFVEAFDRCRRFRLAESDMRLAADTARALLERDDGYARLFERQLDTAVVVIYARPYLDSNKAGVGERWRPTDEGDRAFHRYVIDELRDPYHAHADRTPRRTLVDTTAYLGLEGPPTFAEAWWRLTDDELERVAELAERQADRFKLEAEKAGVELGERRDDPAETGWNV